MNTQDTRRDRQPERRQEDPKRANHPTPRRNPRLVYADPDKFFHDLLMEQQEQS